MSGSSQVAAQEVLWAEVADVPPSLEAWRLVHSGVGLLSGSDNVDKFSSIDKATACGGGGEGQTES